MATAWIAQRNDTSLNELDFDSRFALLIENETLARDNKRISGEVKHRTQAATRLSSGPMKHIGFALIIVLLNAWLATSALANDTAMGGRGANLVPLKTSAVFMESEDITLSLESAKDAKHSGQGDPRPKWHVQARYEFVNPSSEPVELQFGFPEYHCEVAGPEAEDLCQNQMEFHFEGMQTTVRGKPVPHRKGKVDKTHAWAPVLGDVWLFDVTLAPGEQVPIVHEYRVLSTMDSQNGLTADYVTRTGALWGKPIGRARFTFRYPARVCELQGPNTPSEDHAVLPFADFRLIEDSGRWLGEAIYEARNWTPKGDVTFYIRPCTVVRDHLGVEPEKLCPAHTLLSQFIYPGEPDGPPPPTRQTVVQALEKLDDEHLRLCKNYPFAAYGRPFSDSTLSEWFYGFAKPVLARTPFIPFVVNTYYDDKFLTADDRRWVKVVDEVAKARPPAGAPGLDPSGPAPSPLPSTQKPAPQPIAPPPPAARGGCSGCQARGRHDGAGLAAWSLLCLAFLIVGGRRWRRSSTPYPSAR